MLKNNGIEIAKISEITKKIIESVEMSKDQIADIMENTRSEIEYLKNTIEQTKKTINLVISEVDTLEIHDKTMRNKLADVSKNFKIYKEQDIKDAYEKASDIRIKLTTKRSEEKSLREKRDQLEISLNKSLKTIENAEKVMTQIGVVVSYLRGEILAVIDGMDRSSEFLIGLKILEAQENERKRISREIHDGPAQSIANIVMQADICEQIMKSDISKGLKELELLKSNVRSALTDIRGIIFDLRPMILDDLGLIKTLETICTKFTEITKISIETKFKKEPDNLDSIIKVAVMRMIQEIFNNIKKHAKATNVTLTLDFGTKFLLAIIHDNGVGFDVEEVMERIKKKSESFGLIGIMDRIRQLQGTITINSQIGVGTTYHIKLPLNKEVMQNESI
jgi:two-component system sensor histidine kinase DegS